MREIKLSGKGIYLKTVSDEDLPYLYAKESDLEEKYLWSESRCVPVSFEYRNEFWDRLKNFYHTFFMIYSEKDDKPLGFLFSYQFNMHDRICYTTIYVEKAYRKTNVATVAGTLLCDYLFSFFDLRKIYAIVYDYNNASKDFLTHAGFVEEGRQREHRYYNGGYYDMLTLALYRDVFYQKMEKVIENVKKSN